MAKFFICEHCNNQVDMIYDSGIPLVCCGRPMTALAPDTTEARAENHLPEVNIEDERVLVQVGERPHPMIQTHYIAWIALQTDRGLYRQPVPICGPAQALFSVGNETPLAVYAYCNRHGLWTRRL